MESLFKFEDFFLGVSQAYLESINITSSQAYCDIVTSSVTDKFYPQSDSIIVVKRNPKETKLTLTGQSIVGEKVKNFLIPAKISKPGVNSTEYKEKLRNKFIERLWAFLKIKQTLNDSPSNKIIIGEECKHSHEGAHDLAKHYGFVTNYTSLVLLKEDIKEKDDYGIGVLPSHIQAKMYSPDTTEERQAVEASCGGYIKLFQLSHTRGESYKFSNSTSTLPSVASYVGSVKIVGKFEVQNIKALAFRVTGS